MSAAGSQGEIGPDTQRYEPVGTAVRTGANTRTLRSVGVGSTAAFGALLSGLVALVRGAIALMALGISLGQSGSLDTWANGVLFAGRSVVGLILIAVVAAVLGAVVWALAALVYNWVAGVTGGIKVTLE